MSSRRKGPSRTELEAARGRQVADLVAPGLDVLFCGINPSLYSAAVGHHFARPGNRFWPVLHAAGFTPRLLRPEEEGLLPAWGLGITNIVARTTGSAAELTPQELASGGRELEAKVAELRPRVLAVLGVGAYRLAFGEPKAAIGAQARRLADSDLWILPNPSGLNAHFQLPELTALFVSLREALSR